MFQQPTNIWDSYRIASNVKAIQQWQNLLQNYISIFPANATTIRLFFVTWSQEIGKRQKSKVESKHHPDSGVCRCMITRNCLPNLSYFGQTLPGKQMEFSQSSADCWPCTTQWFEIDWASSNCTTSVSWLSVDHLRTVLISAWCKTDHWVIGWSHNGLMTMHYCAQSPKF